MVREASRRQKKFEAKVDADVLASQTRALKPLMVSGQSVYFPDIAAVESKVKTLVEAQAVTSLQVRDYLNFAREMYMLSKRFSSTTLNAEAQVRVDKWVSRGLDGSLLVKTAQLFGVTPTALPTAPIDRRTWEDYVSENGFIKFETDWEEPLLITRTMETPIPDLLIDIANFVDLPFHPLVLALRVVCLLNIDINAFNPPTTELRLASTLKFSDMTSAKEVWLDIDPWVMTQTGENKSARGFSLQNCIEEGGTKLTGGNILQEIRFWVDQNGGGGCEINSIQAWYGIGCALTSLATVLRFHPQKLLTIQAQPYRYVYPYAPKRAMGEDEDALNESNPDYLFDFLDPDGTFVTESTIEKTVISDKIHYLLLAHKSATPEEDCAILKRLVVKKLTI